MEKAKLLVDLWSLHLRFSSLLGESLVFCASHFLLNVTQCWVLHSHVLSHHLLPYLAEVTGHGCVLTNEMGSACEPSSKTSNSFNKNKSRLLVLLGFCGMAG